MTVSIVAYCERTGRFGAAVCSSSPAVAARTIFIRNGAGAAASQNMADPRLGTRLLDLLEQGRTADEAMAQVVNESASLQYRQLSVVDRMGGSAAFRGEHGQGIHDIARAPFVAACGNLLYDRSIPARMVAVFEEESDATLEDRLLHALKTARSLGGEKGPLHSAGLKIIGPNPWPETDLRVDWAKDPIHELEKLWRLWRPLVDDYLTRALDPAAIQP